MREAARHSNGNQRDALSKGTETMPSCAALGGSPQHLASLASGRITQFGDAEALREPDTGGLARGTLGHGLNEDERFRLPL